MDIFRCVAVFSRMDWKPWITRPGLSLERLVYVAEVIRAARNGAADDHRPEKHEGPWSLGCRCFERTWGMLREKAEEHEWLDVVAGPGGVPGGPRAFVMKIGKHDVRVYRARPDRPEDVPLRYREPVFPEWHDAMLDEGMLLRISVENDVDNRPDLISLVEVNALTGNVTNTFIIPLSAHVAPSFGVADEQPAEMQPVVAEPADHDEHGIGSTKKAGSDG